MNRWLKTNITANGWPAAYTAGFDINFEYPDIPLRFPSISITHLGGESEIAGMGNIVRGAAGTTGYIQHQLTEISVWASGQADAPWVRDLWQLRDMVVRLIQRATSLALLNVYGSTANPTTVGIIRFGPGIRVEDAAAPLEPSPNIHRLRLLTRWYYQSEE